MKKIIPFLAFACIAGLTATNSLPIYAGNCSMNKANLNSFECNEKDENCKNKIDFRNDSKKTLINS